MKKMTHTSSRKTKQLPDMSVPLSARNAILKFPHGHGLWLALRVSNQRQLRYMILAPKSAGDKMMKTHCISMDVWTWL